MIICLLLKEPHILQHRETDLFLFWMGQDGAVREDRSVSLSVCPYCICVYVC